MQWAWKEWLQVEDIAVEGGRGSKQIGQLFSGSFELWDRACGAVEGVEA